jgi:Kdo2-lipid IVA lauroyltransferase/acyltransferase
VTRRRPTPTWRRALQRVTARLVEGLGRAAGRLSPRAGARLGAMLGGLAFQLIPARRRVALENLALALPSLPPEARQAIARENFRHLGITAVECCQLFFGPAGALLGRVRFEGVEHIKAAVAEGRGAFYLVGHYGNFELAAAAHSLTGLPPLNVVIRPLDNPFLETVLAAGRTRHQLHLIPKRAAMKGMAAALARRECVAILLDQDAGRHGALVPFFGQPASTSRSLAVLAMKTDAPVVPVSIRRMPDGEHQITIEPAIPLIRSGQLDRDVELNTARFTEALERHVQADPRQWFWVHRRWKSVLA